jgi:replicative DNA helicase
LNSSLESIHTEVSDLRDEDLTKTTKQRLAYYERLATMIGLQGLPTGFATMDLATSGLQKEQLITLVGLQKTYKSMLLMCMNIACHDAGYKTLFASFEMSTTEQSTRHDALRSGISLTRTQTGKLHRKEQIKLRRMMHQLEDLHPLVFIHDPAATTTVSALAAKIRQYKPDVAFIDGTYLMDSEVPGVEPNSPQALTSITRSLKRLAQRCEIPIVQTTQALTWKSRKGLTLDSIGYSSSFAQDSDVIFGVEEVKDSDDREILLRIIAARNCPRKDVRLALDWEHGSIAETGEINFGTDDMDEDGA